MSDLTRRVLETEQYIDNTHVCDQLDIEHSRDILADAAPILARQIEAVEKVLNESAAWIEWEGPDYGAGMHEVAARIRDALQGTDKPA